MIKELVNKSKYVAESNEQEWCMNWYDVSIDCQVSLRYEGLRTDIADVTHIEKITSGANEITLRHLAHIDAYIKYKFDVPVRITIEDLDLQHIALIVTKIN